MQNIGSSRGMIFDQYPDFRELLNRMQSDLVQKCIQANEKLDLNVSDLDSSRVIMNDLYQALIEGIFDKVPVGNSTHVLHKNLSILLAKIQPENEFIQNPCKSAYSEEQNIDAPITILKDEKKWDWDSEERELLCDEVLVISSRKRETKRRHKKNFQ